MVPYISKQKSEGFDVHAPPWRGRRRGVVVHIRCPRWSSAEHLVDERGADLDDAAAPGRADESVVHLVCPGILPMLVDEDAVHLETEERGF